MRFLDPNKPIATCTAGTCEGCPVGETLHCHFTRRDLVQFLLMVAPAFAVGAAGIWAVNAWFLLGWLGLSMGYFLLLEIRVMCSHCPHYAEEGGTLQCWANYGAPRLWKYRPGPMSHWETFWFFAGGLAVLAYPVVFLVLGAQWLQLGLFALTVVSAAATMQTYLCSRCMNFACPLNRVDEATRQAFWARNPRVAEAWGASGPEED